MWNSLPNDVEQPKSLKVHHPYFHILIGYFIKIHDLAKHHFHFRNTVIYQHLNTKEIKIRIYQDLSKMTEAGLRWQSGTHTWRLYMTYFRLQSQQHYQAELRGIIFIVSKYVNVEICNSPKNFMKGTKGWKTHRKRRFFPGTPKVFWISK